MNDADVKLDAEARLLPPPPLVEATILREAKVPKGPAEGIAEREGRRASRHPKLPGNERKANRPLTRACHLR
jgi:hypothetical protein